ALMQKGRWNEAVAQFRIARDLSPTDPQAVAMMALAYDKAGQGEEARRMYRETLKMQGDHSAALNNLAYLLANNGGNLDEALRMAQEAHRRVPNDPHISDTMGWIYLKKNTVDAAVHVFTNNVRLAPKEPLYRYHLALALIAKGDKAGAK